MPFSRSRNSIVAFFDGDVWRATLGSDGNTGVTSTADDPFKAMELTIGKAREQKWKFDKTKVGGLEDADDEDASTPEAKAARDAKDNPSLDRALDKDKDAKPDASKSDLKRRQDGKTGKPNPPAGDADHSHQA